MRRLVATAIAAGLLSVTGVAGLGRAPAVAASPTTILIQAQRGIAATSPYLTGVNNNVWFDDSQGLWDPQAQAPAPGPVGKLERTGTNLVRYPGGTAASLFDWKRAVGPQSERGCQLDGTNGGSAGRDSRYGPDEHEELVSSMNAESMIMMPFGNESAADAADWVEYMNAPLGSNPGGGTAWADRRAANGHPAPYGVRIWEIGNEIDRLHRYWLSPDPEVAARQYVHGGTQVRTDRVRRGCDNRPAAAMSTGRGDQQVQVLYPPVVPGSQSVTVAGEQWREVDDLTTAGPTDRVYRFEPTTGQISFGDGVRGAVPAARAAIAATYTSGPHPGYLDFHDAMKAVDPSIDVIGTWAPITPETGLEGASFPQLMAEAGRPEAYDGVSIHPYTNFARDFPDRTWASVQEGHDEHFLGEQRATGLLDRLQGEVDRWAEGAPYVAVSEFGALWFGGMLDIDAYPTWNNSMSHATYMAVQWSRFANRGTPWVIGNTTTDPGLRAILGRRPDFVYTGDALSRELIRPMVDGGGRVVETKLRNNPAIAAVEPNSGAYDQLAVTAARGTDGRVRIMVVNTHATDAITTRIVPAGIAHDRRVDVGVVTGRELTSRNDEADPDAITLTRSTETVDAQTFERTFPAASVTLLTLTPR